MSTRIRTLNFLPEVFQTKTNAQFLAATLDQIVAQPETKRIEGYVGSKVGYGINAKDFYVTEPTKTRTDYQLDPGVVFKKVNQNTAKDFISYPGIIDALKTEGGITDNNERLFTSEIYSWDSFTNLDKIINFNQYYWIPEGPDDVVITNQTVYYANDYVVYNLSNGYNIVPVTSDVNTGSTNPTLTLLRGGTYTFAVNQPSQFWIQGEPGVTGFSLTQPNVQTREIVGVENNGSTQGIVTFNVPPKDAQSEYNFPGNNLVDLVSTVPFAQINGAKVSDLVNGIDGVTSLNNLTLMFYNTGLPNEVAYVSNFFDYTNFDINNDLTPLQTITVTATNVSGAITCNSTENLIVGNAIIFSGTTFGGIPVYSETVPDTILFVHSIIDQFNFQVSLTIGGSPIPLTTASGSMTATINQGQYEQGYNSVVNDYFYRITYIGDPSDPVIRLTQESSIPINQKITAVYGTQWIARNFFKNTSGFIQLIPYLSAQLDTLYYQDGTSPNKVGIIRLIESNVTNSLNVETDILGKPQYTSTNGIVFTNGLKISFQGDIFPRSYLSGEYYVEGVGTSIELLPTTDFISPEDFTEAVYDPWDTAGWDSIGWEGSVYIPVKSDYITISRNAIDRNAWSRSNRWFHIDVINATATYNNNPSLVTLYTNPAFKAKRPIIEFYPNLKLFNSGVQGKAPVDFIDTRTTDAFTLVAGQLNYYPDIEVYTEYDATIQTVNYTPGRTCTAASDSTKIFTCNSTTGFQVNDIITFTGVPAPNNITTGISYYVVEVLGSNTFKISNLKGGTAIGPNTGSPFTGSCAFTWSPQSTNITIPASSINGTFTVGQYVADSTNTLPRNAQIVSITGTTTLTLNVEWDSVGNYFDTQTNSSIVGSDTTVDNYALFDGARIIFTADSDPNVKNKIYISRLSIVSGTTPIITLSEAPDGEVLVNQQTVALRGFYNFGNQFWYDGIDWISGQQKIDLNQPPLFDIFDKNDISFGNSEIYVGTSFTGCKLFAYGLGSGLDDSVLGFPVRYSAVDNVGDISFDVSINKDTFNYVSSFEPVTQKVNTGYVFQYENRINYIRQLGWQTAVSPSVQYQIFNFSYDVLNPITTFECDVEKNSSSSTNWPTIKVFVNNVALDSSDYTVTVSPNKTAVTLNSAPITNTVIQILLLSDQVSEVGYYETPVNLNNNPLNEDLTVTNVGDIRGQYQSAFLNNPNTTGEVFGPNNYRDLGNMVPWGNKIIQNSASLVLPGAFLRKQEYNLFNALMFNSKEYVKFKNLLVYTVQNSDYVQRYTPSELLDDALDQITAAKNDTQPFFWSDMLPNKAPYITNTYSFANSLDVSIYPLSRIYNFATANYYGVLVYLTRTTSGITKNTQLVKNVDYTVSENAPSLTIDTDLLPGDLITIKEYNQTYGSYVPNTPTKLGLYPSYIPAVVLDTSYTNPTYFIKGHDGSYNKLYGNYDPVNGILDDFRDQVLFEFELRVYNNLKIDAILPIQLTEITPGYFRDSDYSETEWLNMYSTQFLNWIGQNRLEYKTQFYTTSNSFTFNYSKSGNALNKSVITQGNWRGVYQYYYDTTNPNTTPWEMLGFTSMPAWWTTRYGPAPYTSDNLILWGDLEQGLVWNNGEPYVNSLYARPGLSEIIPVDSAGTLLPPIDSIVGSYNERLFQRDWKIGDNAPVEFSYRRSSTFPFDLVRLMALMKPAKFYNLGVNLDKYKFNEEFNQYLVNDRSHLQLGDIEVYGNGTPVTSYINWIVDYEKQIGVDATTNISEMLANLDVRLVYRLAGFSDKKLLKFYVEKGTPNSNNASLLIPDESYSVLLYDNQPFNRIIYSGVIVQKVSNGYSVYGNSQTIAYFKTLKPKFGGNYETISVEGVSVKVTMDHFEIERYTPYGEVFSTIQEASQFLIDYGAYLTYAGMKFEDQEAELTINWPQMVAEFLYWAQTNWSVGSVVTLNPSARQLTIDKDSNIVQPLTLQQQNFVLNQNLYPIQTKDLCIDRQGTAFSIETLNQGDTISYGQFNLSNFEHGIVFDNVTLFGDVIYNLITGLRQSRITLKGTKSADWNGTVNAAGFIYNQDNIKEWNIRASYTKGEIVTYKNKYWIATKIIQPSEIFKEEDWKRTDYDEIQKGLLPNSSTRSYESTLYYDVNQTNLESDADLLGFSLIGYRPRDYMSFADLTDITQVNVYKNMIKEKGTLNAVSAFRGAQLPQGGIDYEIYENWAIKAGEFGGVLNNNFIEFKVNQKYMTGNPSIVGLTDGVDNIGVQQEVPIYSLFNYERPIDNVNVLSTINSTEPSMLYPDAGYVNYNDVKMSAFYYAQLPFAVNRNGVIIPIQEFYVRDYVWLANYLERWQVFTPVSIGQVVQIYNNLNETLTVTFNNAHNLREFEPFAIVNFDEAIDGYYLAAVVLDSYRVLVSKILDPSIKEIVAQGIGLKFQAQRVATPADITTLPLLDSEFRQNTVWVDTNTDGSWGVYKKNLNYKLQSQLTKSTSQSLGSAVAIGDRLGYLIGDADDGKVYRYTYNELEKQYVLIQQLTGNVGFGSTISYAGDIYIIAQPTGVGRCIKLYQLQNTNISDDLILIQTINNPAVGVTTWGTSIAISGDTNWIYVSDIDNNTIYVYLKANTPTTAGYFVIGETYTITSAGTTDFTTVGATSSEVGVMFIATGVGTGTGTAVNNTYRNVTTIDADSLGLTTAGDNFGYSLSTDYDGDCIFVGAPNKNYNTLDNWGYAYSFDRIKQNIEAQNNVTPAIYSLIWTPTSLSGSLTDTNATGDILTLNIALDAVEDLNKPVMFTGSGLAGTGIVEYQIYYVSTISGFNITIKETRESLTDYQVNTVSSIVGASAHVQTEQLNVYRNGRLVTDDNYAAVNNTLVYVGELTAGDIITVNGYEIVLTQTLTTQETPQIGSQFGFSLDTNTHASELLIGAPFQLNSQIEEGAVYRFTDAGAKYGIVTGTSECNVTTTRKILINGYLVVITSGNAEHVAEVIRNTNITNVTATSVDNVLVISLINSNLAPINQKLFLSFDSTTTITELGLTVYIKTQEILCPHPYGPTQFGTVIKFNSYDSFVVSAPVGTRYSATTFDFIDDENQDNDTIFDNNATQWVEESPNFGAVYMFDYISQYNANIQNTGKFIYAQSINSPNLVYSPYNTYDQDTDVSTSNQPRYGTALDFNDYGVIVGTPNDIGSTTGATYAGSVTAYNNEFRIKDWSIYRYSAPVVDINKIFNIQIFSAETNSTLTSLDYIDPLQGKILGAARENIDYVANNDPAIYNNTPTVPTGLVWGAAHVGKIWLNTTNMRYVNYHQNNDITYNAQYWATLFPGSDVAVYSWISSPALPSEYLGPGTPFDINQYSIQYVINPSGSLTPVYYFWARDTNTIFSDNNKTLADSIIASYIENPKSSGISYFAGILPNVYGLYNAQDYINANDSVLHIGYATGSNDDVAHRQFNLIRDGNPSDFLPGIPLIISGVPESLYDRMLDSLSGVDETGAVVPNPYLPKAVQSGVLARPRQSFFYNRFTALKNYLQYANSILAQYPISEIRLSSFLTSSGLFYETSNYWEYINWWAEGYDDNVKPAFQVSIYADLATLNVAAGTIVTVTQNANGNVETYIFESTGDWRRIGLQNGTIRFKSSLWDYPSVRLGFGDNFFDTDLYDVYPSEETRKITRALNEEIFIEDLLIYRNQSLILLFKYIQSEASENQNYLPWLNKTSFIDVAHTIRELRPIEVFQTDNQEFLSGYLNEVKPYHVVIKEFLFKYTGEEFFAGNITDFDLPATYNNSLQKFITPQLVYQNSNGVNQFLPNDSIWEEQQYTQWKENYGVSLTGENEVQMTTLASYISLNSESFSVDNSQGFPINGVIQIGTEQIGYSTVDRALNVISGLTRGVNGTNISTHIPGALIFMNLPAVLVLDGARGYTEPPKVTAYIDTTKYPEPRIPAQLVAVMGLDSVLRIDTINSGSGYAVLPEIIIDPSIVVNFSSSAVSTLSSTVELFAPLLQTGDLIKYTVGENTTAIGGLVNNQWYYINVLETVPSVVVGFYDNYSDAILNHDRIVLYSAGSGNNHFINLGARASAISTSYPVRENNLSLRFDRTTYNSDIIEWRSGVFYGAFFAGAYHNIESVSSSSITLQSTQPPIDSILASAQGVAFEITDVRNERVVTYSSFVRNVLSTESSDNSVRLILQDDGSGNPNASGGTTGFYIGMVLKFVGAVGSSGIVNEQVYYVHSIINQTDFTLSSDPSGSPIVSLNDWTISVAGLQCFVAQVNDTAIVTVNYPGILNITETESVTNKITIPLSLTGTGGTTGFYINLPIFFTGTTPTEPQNGVFGGIVENEVYYVTTVIDDQTFTMSQSQNPQTFDVTSTVAATDAIVIDTSGGDTNSLSLNEPVIFNTMVISGANVTNFGGLESGTVYYVSSILNTFSFTVSTEINGSTLSLTNVAAASDTSALATSQKDTYKLTTATGNSMVVNVNLPVSPGQVNGQKFTFYETSEQYPGIVGSDLDLIYRNVLATIGKRVVPALDLVTGQVYTILTVGTTDFTLVGAASNTIGVTFTATGPAIGTGTVTIDVNQVLLSNFVPGTTVSLGLTNIYINMPFQVSTNLGTGFLTTGTTYYVVDMDTVEIEVTSTSSTGNLLRCASTASLFIDMPITFAGTGMGNVEIDVEYWIKDIVDNEQFTITNTPGGTALTLSNASGSMIGTGVPYLQLGTSLGGTPVDPGDTQQTATITIAIPGVVTVAEAPANGTTIIFRTTGSLPGGLAQNTTYYVVNATSTTFEVALTSGGASINTTGSQSGTHTMIITTDLDVTQTPISTPVFDVSYILGGYRVIIADDASGYAINNTIEISGADMGGTSPANDLLLTVSAIGTFGEITGVICSGIAPGVQNEYYVKAISSNEFALYENQLLTIPVSGIGLPYVGYTTTIVTALDSSSEELTLTSITGFNVNDGVVFTGDLTPTVGAITEGVTYYITSIVGNEITISAVPGGTNINIPTTIAANFNITKSGSFMFLPEPFIFNQSIVKYNGRVYICIISNNDDEFVFGKWELLTSGDRRLNAMDRVMGYYEPTVNMPGKDLSQLFEGVTYPNSIYLGNYFQPSLQYPIDTILQDQIFYPVEVDITAILFDGSKYVATANMPNYSSVISNNLISDWEIKKLTNTPINTTDVIFAGGFYLLTSRNAATPIFRSTNGIDWTTNGYFTPWGSLTWDEFDWDTSALSVSSLYLNSVGYYNNTWVAVGHNIVSSDDTFVWRERFIFANAALANELYGVDGINTSSFAGFVAVGKGQEYDYSTGITVTVDCNLLYTSSDGIIWNGLPTLSSLGMYGVTDNGTDIVIVGEDGIIYISTDGINWIGVNETQATGINVNSPNNQLIVASTAGFAVNDEVIFNKSFNVFTAGVTYYVQSIVSPTEIKLSASFGGAAVTMNTGTPLAYTYMYKPRTNSLRDVLFANGIYMAVGDSGLIRTSTDGYTWVNKTSGTTENLNGITYKNAGSIWTVCGDNNTIITSIDNGTTWISTSVFAPESTIYDVQGAEFTYGYGPEELVPGVVTDNLTMTVVTRPGTNWDETIYQHVGYNVVTIEQTPTSGTQTIYSFDVGNLYNLQSPAKIAVFVIDGSTELGTAIYEPAYSVNWVNNTITLATPLAFSPITNRLRINVYEVGNGSQLVKSSTKSDPIRLNATTGWNEIYVNCNYSGEIYSGSGVIRPSSFPVDVIATSTSASSNSITCASVRDFVLNDPIRFQGTVFGGVQEDTTYYVKTISYTTNRITISETINVAAGTAGPTFTLTDGTGSMNIIIKIGYGATWTAPIVYHNGNKLLLGTTSTVTRTKSSTNTIVTNTTSGMIVNEPIVFSDTMFGPDITPQTVYYIHSIVDDNEFAISATAGGAILTLTDATGGAEFMTNDYAFGIQPNGISASIIFNTGTYDASTDYISYTLFGETTPTQYGYTIPETQIITTTTSTGPYSLTNYVGDDNPTNAIVELNGLRLNNTDYTISSISNTITLTSAPTNGSTLAVTTFNLTDRQYLNTQYGLTGKTVSKITNIQNNLSAPSTITVTQTIAAGNLIVCNDTGTLSAGQTIVFKGSSSLGGIQVDGTVYFVSTVSSATQFTISATPGGPTFTLTNDSSTTLIAYVGGLVAVRVTTSSAHNLTTNDFVRIDNVVGSTQLNNNTYYVHVISSTIIDLYLTTYDPALNAVNDPVTNISSYVSGGYIWETTNYVLVTTTVTQTTTSVILGNYLTVADTSMLVVGTPVIFTGTSLGGVQLNTIYYIKSINNATAFTISETRYGDEFVLTNAVGSMNMAQWQQENVDRLWVTVNGYRVSSTSLRINVGNEISILTEIDSSDVVIITSMMPSATPNEEIYLLNVNQVEEASVYRANTQTRSWLTQPLYDADDTIYVYDVTRLTDVITQNSTVPAAIDGIYTIGINADKRSISNITIYNNTTGQYISDSNFELSIENVAPVVKITAGAYISAGNSLTITILQGNLIYINGEQIKFSSVDLVNNTITGLQRGANSTGEQTYIPEYTEVYGIISTNQLPLADYVKTWNSNTYDTELGDPLQISTTESAIFLRGDIN